jgi:hypothetical protein
MVVGDSYEVQAAPSRDALPPDVTVRDPDDRRGGSGRRRTVAARLTGSARIPH